MKLLRHGISRSTRLYLELRYAFFKAMVQEGNRTLPPNKQNTIDIDWMYCAGGEL